ncbi:hypothetical protein AC1031_007851 [Aphanomyces cochlioides]|nr:hypothetical protein AC1031_007842 [Aphanomyces cochlioides]KAG9402147.1 hypothetical protein AC1031_007851 [Aphanomyces cochlioides]
MPNWITSLGLDEQKMIKIGNKLFCKPSTQVTLGCASIVQPESGKDTTKSSATMSPENETTTIISVYCLLPILLSMHNWLPTWATPTVFGTVTKNMFTPRVDAIVSREKYIHTRERKNDVSQESRDCRGMKLPDYQTSSKIVFIAKPTPACIVWENFSLDFRLPCTPLGEDVSKE